MGEENVVVSGLFYPWSHESSYESCSEVEPVFHDLLLVCSTRGPVFLYAAVCESGELLLIFVSLHLRVNYV